MTTAKGDYTVEDVLRDEIALLRANLHEARNPKHVVSFDRPYVCSCGWAEDSFKRLFKENHDNSVK